MVGIDIVQISRIKNPKTLANKVLSKEELKLFNATNNKNQFLAGRFAAKEAFLKANHKGLGEIPLNKIKVLYTKEKAPFISYNNKKYDVSISHDGDYAIAVVML